MRPSGGRAKVCPAAGDKQAGQLKVRLHYGDPQGAKPKGEVIADILAGIEYLNT